MNKKSDLESTECSPFVLLDAFENLRAMVDRLEEPSHNFPSGAQNVFNFLNLNQASYDQDYSNDFVRVQDQELRIMTKKNNQIITDVNGIRFYKCGFCSKDYNTHYQLGGHVQKIHSKNQNAKNQARYTSLRKRAIQK